MPHAVGEHAIAATVHGHYLVAVPPGDGPWPLLVGFHGYGETARDHLRELLEIPGTAGWLVCAVQGLHPFYRRNGEVVANWMTRLNRELAIADNLRYVAGVVAAVRDRHPVSSVLVYAGFSQGVAMAYRATAARRPPARGVVALAGDLPPDVAGEALAALPPLLIGRGDGEEWYDAAKLESDLARLRAAGIEPEVVSFAGGHEWTPAFRARAGDFLRRIATAGV